ncbi:hypothetical protein ILUMI_27505 [Ignelater luminosus]|uniref:DDE-1 domain-containing protein n=1 Tax=Ignelater luminosus TaxID=2038154 RepID=A0A8K0FXX4_IGNLU|nr:hypothetical protein ILUMI_27505 [Ignelater luminosus]
MDGCSNFYRFESLFIPHAKRLPKHKVLIGDNLLSNSTASVLRQFEENDIAFACLPKNSTHLTQPLNPLENGADNVRVETDYLEPENSKIVTETFLPMKVYGRSTRKTVYRYAAIVQKIGMQFYTLVVSAKYGTNFVALTNRKEIRKNSEWLSGEFEFPKFVSTINTRLHLVRPTLPYQTKSTRSQRRDAAKLSSENQQQTGLIMKAVGIAARATETSDLAAELKEVFKSPTRPPKIRKTLLNSEKFPISFNAEKALTFLLDNNFRKLACKPLGLEVDATTAKIPLDSLLEHTAKRIVSLQKEVIIRHCNEQSLYKQKFPDSQEFSKNFKATLFATTTIPLRLISLSGNILWNNQTPQSVRFCDYAKETKNHVLKEKKSIDEEISKLKDVERHLILLYQVPVLKKRLDNQRHKQLPREVIKLVACTEEPEKDTSETIFNTQDPQDNSDSEASDGLQEENNTETYFKVLDTIVLNSES